jgi:hypothetical protein
MTNEGNSMDSLLLASPPENSAASAAMPVSASAIEYMTRDLFKGKSVQQAARTFHRKFHGKQNLFLGVMNHSIEELASALLKDKAELAIASIKRTLPGNGLRVLQGTAERFNLDMKALAQTVLDVLASGEPAITVKGPDPIACAVMGLNAAHPAMSPAHAPDVDEAEAEEESVEPDAAAAPRA